MHMGHVLSVHQLSRWGFFFQAYSQICVQNFFEVLLCIIIEFIAADFYNDLCCLSCTCLLITRAVNNLWFCLFYSLNPMKNLSSDGERVKSFIFPPDIFIFLLYFLVVYYATDFFVCCRHNLIIPKLVLPAFRQKYLYKSCGYRLLSGKMVRIKWAHVFLKFVKEYMVLLFKANQTIWIWHLIQYF